MKADRRVLTACAALLALAGCDRAPVRTPANLAGEWVQVDLNGDPLPRGARTATRGVCA